MTAETNKFNEAVSTAANGNEVAKAFDIWASYFESWLAKMKTLEEKKGFKFLKAATPPDELRPDLEAYGAAMQAMSESLQGKMELYKENPKFIKRVQKVFRKTKKPLIFF